MEKSTTHARARTAIDRPRAVANRTRNPAVRTAATEVPAIVSARGVVNLKPNLVFALNPSNPVEGARLTAEILLKTRTSHRGSAAVNKLNAI